MQLHHISQFQGLYKIIHVSNNTFKSFCEWVWYHDVVLQKIYLVLFLLLNVFIHVLRCIGKLVFFSSNLWILWTVQCGKTLEKMQHHTNKLETEKSKFFSSFQNFLGLRTNQGKHHNMCNVWRLKHSSTTESHIALHKSVATEK